MENKNTKHITTALIMIAVILGSFGGGFFYGSTKTHYEYSTPYLKNKTPDSLVTNAVDFAPFWKAWNMLNDKHVPIGTSTKHITDQDRVWGAISGLTGSLDDPYTTFFPPVEAKAFNEEVNGNFSGIGAELAIRDRGLVVVAPLKGSPAEKSGLRSDDLILAVDNNSAAGITIEEAVDTIRGEKGTEVTLTVSRKDVSDPLDVVITRDDIQIPVINTDNRTEDGVFVISLYSFTSNSPSQFRDALQEFADSGKSKLVIDLRNNPGGFLDASISMASWFLPEGQVVVTEDFGPNGEDRVYRSKGYNVFKKDLYDVAILINGGSASASEILAGALREHGVAELVGTKSFGKGSVQELVDLTSETSLKVTVARWLTPDGNSISQNGLVPDHIIEFTEEDIEAGIDVQLEKAVEILMEK